MIIQSACDGNAARWCNAPRPGGGVESRPPGPLWWDGAAGPGPPLQGQRKVSLLYTTHPYLSILVRHGLPLALAVAAVALQWSGEAVIHALRYERGAVIADGEWWRLLTGHLVHLGWSHLWLNLAGLALVWMLVGPYWSIRAWWITAFVCMAGTSAGLLLGMPDLVWYVGLSGVLHGLLVAGVLAGVAARHKDMMLLLLGISAKLAWEQWHGPLPGSVEAAGGPVVVDAHLYGAIAGALVAVVMLGRRHGVVRARQGSSTR